METSSEETGSRATGPARERRGPSRSLRARSLLAVLSLLASCGAEKAAADSRPRHGVLVVAVDGLRADHLGCLGYDRDTSPELDSMAAEGVLFSQAFAPAPLPIPSEIGILTGVEPFLAQRRITEDFGFDRWYLPEGLPSLAVEFLAAGYRTAAFFGDPRPGRPGELERGFLEYQVAEEDSAKGGGGNVVGVRRLLSWLRTNADSDWFVYLELADLPRSFGRSWRRETSEWDRYFERRPSLSAVPPVGSTEELFFALPNSLWLGGSRPLGEYEAIYDGNLRRVDAEIGALRAGLRRLGLADSTTLAVVGTHGLQFGEAGLFLRSGLYSPADLHVPFVLAPRSDLGGVPGRVLSELTSLLDLAPTLLESEGIPVPAGMRGVSRLPEIVGGSSAREADAGERRAFASCGLLGGGVVLQGTKVFELSLPGQLPAGSLRRSWFGETDPGAGALPLVRFYDREEVPYPPLQTIGAAQESPALDQLRAVAKHWIEGMRDARGVLQNAVLTGDPVGRARLEELVRTGYLGPSFFPPAADSRGVQR